jgi:hypothetical protein
MQESSKKNVLRVISAQDSIEDTEVSGARTLSLHRRLSQSKCCACGNTHILSYTDTYYPYTRSMKRLRKSCETRSFYTCMQKIREIGVWRIGITHQLQHTFGLLCLLLIDCYLLGGRRANQRVGRSWSSQLARSTSHIPLVLEESVAGKHGIGFIPGSRREWTLKSVFCR